MHSYLLVLVVTCMPYSILAWQQLIDSTRWRSCGCSRTRRRRVEPLSAAPNTETAAALGPSSPCFWYEEPSETRRVSAPFGRAQKGVEACLQTLNWQKRSFQEQKQPPMPNFTFKYPGAPTFCAYHPDIPGRIRQIPTSWGWDDHLDDKLCLHLLLSAATANTTSAVLSDIVPPTFVVNNALLTSLEGGEVQGDEWWFLKHRLDAKRPRVRPYNSTVDLRERLRQMREGSWKYFIVQKEIYPPLLIHNRKFVLRAHVLAWVCGGNTLRLCLHSDPLVSENEAPFEASCSSLPALVLQSGSRSAAYLLSESDALFTLRTSILEQMSSIVAAVFHELHTQHIFPLVLSHAQHPNDNEETLYQLYGLDFMLNSTGKVFLLEVNRSPRIATGAMGDVHRCYTKMLMEALQILGVTNNTSSKEYASPDGFGAWRNVYRAAL